MIKKKNRKRLLFIPLLFSSTLPSIADEKIDGQHVFIQQCSLCHAIDKKKLGPAVKMMSHEAEVLHKVIKKGKNAMPAYAGKLTNEEIKSLVDYLLTNQ